MSHSLLVLCACCGKLVITKNKSKRRCCSHRCYMRMHRLDKRAEQEAAKTAASAEQAAI